MIKLIDVHGRRVKLYSSDNGRTWSSSPQSIIAYGQRKQLLRGDLQKAFERLPDISDPEPNTDVELGIRRGLK
jgi:hypothetical protein